MTEPLAVSAKSPSALSEVITTPYRPVRGGVKVTETGPPVLVTLVLDDIATKNCSLGSSTTSSVMGTETEFGISVQGHPHANPMVANMGRGIYRVIVQAMTEVEDPQIQEALNRHVHLFDGPDLGDGHPRYAMKELEARGIKTCGHNADQSSLAPKGFLHVRMTVQQPDQQGFGLAGSGMFIINPPYTLHDEENTIWSMPDADSASASLAVPVTLLIQ